MGITREQISVVMSYADDYREATSESSRRVRRERLHKYLQALITKTQTTPKLEITSTITKEQVKQAQTMLREYGEALGQGGEPEFPTYSLHLLNQWESEIKMTSLINQVIKKNE